MKEQKLNTKVELYICNFQKENGECCFNRGSKILTDHLKSWAKENHSGVVKIVRGGCLGKCSEGIAFSMYQENEKKLFTDVSSNDEESIKSLISSSL